MAYDKRAVQRGTERFEEDRRAHQEAFAAKRQKLFREIPRLEEIDRELRSTMAQIVTSALRRGADPGPAISVIRDNNMALQRERAALLMEHGYEPDELEEKPRCVLCGDTGYVNGAMCRCLRTYCSRAQIEELSRLLDMGGASFETFDFELYSTVPYENLHMSPREKMEKNFDACRDYAYQFGPRSGNLLLSGQTGTGKTFLSACIARVVSERGFSVVYDTATHIFAQYEAVKFRREEDETAEEDVRRCANCDLLILDDLGTEMSTSFVQSALYQIVNDRLLAGKKTIINTNLSPEKIGARYSQQIFSRIQGEYDILTFFGEDIRLLKRRKQ